MAASPTDHVKDIPYFAISKDYGIMFPTVTSEDHHIKVEWKDGGVENILGYENGTPAFFTVHGFSLCLCSVLLIFGAFKAVKGISARPEAGRGVTAQLFEVLIKFVRDDVCKPNMGPHGSKYYPLMLTFFFLVLFCNLWGMVPLLVTATATGNINVTAAFAVIVLVLMFVLGMKEQGVGHFWKNLVPSGLPVAIMPLMYPIEFIGPFAKCFALCIRLYANMIAGHIVLAAFGAMAFASDGSFSFGTAIPAYAMSVAISLLEVFVAFLQAYIFTLLTSVFLGSFIHPDH